MTKAVKSNPELTLDYDQLPLIIIKVHGQYIFGINSGKKFSAVYISFNKNEVIPDMTKYEDYQLSKYKIV